MGEHAKQPVGRSTEVFGEMGNKRSGNKPVFRLIPIVLAMWVAVVYCQVGGFEFTNYDDNIYVSENPHIARGLTLSGIRWAFTTGYAGNWHPLTWVSHMLDVSIFGLDPGGHHLTSVGLHILNTLLLFALLHSLTGFVWRSAFVAALFALHPLHVESVAWVAERKDVLSTLFWLLTMLAYVRYVRGRDRGRPLRGRVAAYVLVVVLYALGLMAKPMLVTLPIVLMLLDWWPLGRIRPSTLTLQPSDSGSGLSALREKLPLFVLAFASCVITFLVQKAGGRCIRWISSPWLSGWQMLSSPTWPTY